MPLSCLVSSAMFPELPWAYRLVSLVALFFVLSDSQCCEIQFLVDAVVGVQGFLSAWRLMLPRTHGHRFRYGVTPAGLERTSRNPGCPMDEGNPCGG